MSFKDELSQFTGTLAYHRVSYYPIKATDGILFFAEKAGAFWLMDEIGHAVTRPLKNEPFICVKVKSKDGKADIRFEDGDYKHLLTKHIPFTDLEEGEYKFFYTDNVLMLPSEY